jgi:hypothetical protein
VSNATKSSIYAAYGVAQAKKRLYVIDHLISLELGGSNVLANLWPQPVIASRAKDVIEGKLHTAVCARMVPLRVAQQRIAKDWKGSPGLTITTTAANLSPTTAPPPPTLPPPPPPTAAPAPQANPGNGVTALCNDGTYSYSAHHQGTCSFHGGVREFYR